MSIDPPKESGLYVVDCDDGEIRLRNIDMAIPGIRVADFDDNRLSNWDGSFIVRYRRKNFLVRSCRNAGGEVEHE